MAEAHDDNTTEDLIDDLGIDADDGAADPPPDVDASSQDVSPPSDGGEALDEGRVDDPPADDKQADPDEVTRMVDLRALQESREENRALRQQVAEAEVRASRVDDLHDQLQAMRNPPKEPEPAPDFIDDPQGYVDHQVQERTAALETQQREQADANAQANQQNQMNQFLANVRNDEAVFKTTHADYDTALEHARDLRRNELKLRGWDNEDHIERAIGQEEYGVAMDAIQRGQSPAEVGYQRAIIMGYKAPETDPTQISTKALDEESQRREKALDARGMGSDGSPDVDSMLEADQDEFDEMFAELGYGKEMT